MGEIPGHDVYERLHFRPQCVRSRGDRCTVFIKPSFPNVLVYSAPQLLRVNVTVSVRSMPVVTNYMFRFLVEELYMRCDDGDDLFNMLL